MWHRSINKSASVCECACVHVCVVAIVIQCPPRSAAVIGFFISFNLQFINEHSAAPSIAPAISLTSFFVILPHFGSTLCIVVLHFYTHIQTHDWHPSHLFPTACKVSHCHEAGICSCQCVCPLTPNLCLPCRLRWSTPSVAPYTGFTAQTPVPPSTVSWPIPSLSPCLRRRLAPPSPPSRRLETRELNWIDGF